LHALSRGSFTPRGPDARKRGRRGDRATALAAALLIECAASLDLEPTELFGLLDDARKQALDAVAHLALERLDEPKRVRTPDTGTPQAAASIRVGHEI